MFLVCSRFDQGGEIEFQESADSTMFRIKTEFKRSTHFPLNSDNCPTLISSAYSRVLGLLHVHNKEIFGVGTVSMIMVYYHSCSLI